MELASRSVITNGKRLHRGRKAGGVDGRSASARRFRDLVQSFASELGGMDRLSEGDRALVRQAATITYEAEQLQAVSTRGEQVDHDALIRLSNTARRILTSLRARRPAKPDTGLHGYLASKRGAS